MHRTALIVAACLLAAGCAGGLDVHYEPTPPAVVEGMLDMAKVGPGDFLIDLGSGDGRIPIAAGGRGARALGVDLDPQRVVEAQQNLAIAGVGDRVSFRQQNLFETDIRDATVVTLYLFYHLNQKLRPRLLAELKPGTRVVSHHWDMQEWRADQQATIAGKRVFMWIIPARAAGRWRLDNGASGSLELELRQDFQNIAGRATRGGRTVPLGAATLSGATIVFTVDFGDGPRRYEGRIDGERMSGGSSWRARRLP